MAGGFSYSRLVPRQVSVTPSAATPGEHEKWASLAASVSRPCSPLPKMREWSSSTPSTVPSGHCITPLLATPTNGEHALASPLVYVFMNLAGEKESHTTQEKSNLHIGG